MTSIIERFTGPHDDLEDAPMTTPRQFPAARGTVPWWAGVPGLDPAVPVTDWEAAARYTALACSVHAYGPDAVYKAAVLSFGKKAAPANLRLRAWLLEGVMTPEAAGRRRFALRMAVEHGGALKPDDLLLMAQDFADALVPG